MHQNIIIVVLGTTLNLLYLMMHVITKYIFITIIVLKFLFIFPTDSDKTYINLIHHQQQHYVYSFYFYQHQLIHEIKQKLLHNIWHFYTLSFFFFFFFFIIFFIHNVCMYVCVCVIDYFIIFINKDSIQHIYTIIYCLYTSN